MPSGGRNICSPTPDAPKRAPPRRRETALTQGAAQGGDAAELARALRESFRRGVDAVILVDSQPVRRLVTPEFAGPAPPLGNRRWPAADMPFFCGPRSRPMPWLTQTRFSRLWNCFQWTIGGTVDKRRLCLKYYGGQERILEVGCSTGWPKCARFGLWQFRKRTGP